MKELCALAEKIWSPWLLGAFLALGGLFSLRTGFFQLFGAGQWLKAVGRSMFGKSAEGEGALSQFQAVATALAATIGTGSIAGVATAIVCGGSGAVFWMWVCAFLGMMIGFVEKTLAVRYRRREGDGWKGGPMEYMEYGLKAKRLAIWYALAVTVAALGGGGLVQANSIAAGLWEVFGWNRLAVGTGTALVTALVIFGGIGRIGRVCERLTPVMAALFLLGGGVVLAVHREMLLPALVEILSEAFAPKSMAGGTLGYGMATALRYGVARGVFTNEAGLGSSAMAHAQARMTDPAEQGMWGIFEVFFSTLVICTVSALVILTSGVYDKALYLSLLSAGAVGEGQTGAPLAARAFGTVFGPWGGIFVALCLVLFAFSSLLGWSYYGERGLERLVGGRRGRGLFRLAFLGSILAGSVGELDAVWQLSDLCNALMAIPNLLALALLSPEAFALWRAWMKKQRP